MCRNSETNPPGFNVISIDYQCLHLHVDTPLLIALTDSVYHTLNDPSRITLNVTAIGQVVFYH